MVEIVKDNTDVNKVRRRLVDIKLAFKESMDREVSRVFEEIEDLDTEIQEGEDRVGTIALARADLGMCQRLAVVQVIAQRQARADRRMAEQLRDKRCAVHRLQPGRPQDALQAIHVVGAPLTWRSR